MRRRLVDALCSNAPGLAGSVASLRGVERSDVAAYHQHRNALQLHVFFLAWINALAPDTAEADSKRQQPPGVKAAAKPRGKKAAAAAAAAEGWDVPACHEAVLRALLTLLRADSSHLFDGQHEQHRMVDLCVQQVGRIRIGVEV